MFGGLTQWQEKALRQIPSSIFVGSCVIRINVLLYEWFCPQSIRVIVLIKSVREGGSVVWVL